MPRPAMCQRCNEAILERGNEVPSNGGLYHRICYEGVREEAIRAVMARYPTVDEMVERADAARTPRG